MGTKIIMNQDLLKKIIEYGVEAPSGDNSQPWKFVITKDNKIFLYNIADKDNPILNVHEGGSMISHGAVILNMEIAADSFGYKTTVSYFPDSSIKDLVAVLSFVKNNKLNNFYSTNFLESIKKRCTNRNHYKKELGGDIKNKLDQIAKVSDLKVKLFYNEKDKDFLASCISISEEIILQTKDLHELLFADVMWTKKEESIKRHGLYVKTLEFNPIQFFVFWLCRRWKNISFLNKKIGFSKIVGKQNALIYKSSGVIGFILIPNTDKINYVKAGELLQYIWLKATNLGLGFQPVTGLFFLNERRKIFGNDPMSEEDGKKICDTYNSLRDYIKTEDDSVIVTSFRIGLSKDSSGRSSRLKPNIILK